MTVYGSARMGGSDSTSTESWTQERTKRLRELCEEGLSAAQISRALGGVSRNSVIGKLRRMGWQLRGPQCLHSSIRVAKPKPAPKPKAARVDPVPIRKAPMAMPTPTLAEIEAEPAPSGVRHPCKWPIGDPRAAGFKFCCKEAAVRDDGTPWPYCQTHRDRAFAPTKTSAGQLARSVRNLR